MQFVYKKAFSTLLRKIFSNSVTLLTITSRLDWLGENISIAKYCEQRALITTLKAWPLCRAIINKLLSNCKWKRQTRFHATVLKKWNSSRSSSMETMFAWMSVDIYLILDFFKPTEIFLEVIFTLFLINLWTYHPKPRDTFHNLGVLHSMTFLTW